MASCNTPFTSMFLLICFFMLTNSVAATPTYVYRLCPDINTLGSNSTYLNNVNTLLTFLSSNSTNENRFFNTTVGSPIGPNNNVVYGAFFCLVDATTAACQECITLAIRQLNISCQGKKSVIVWFDSCLVRYSNVSFFGDMSADPMVGLWNRPGVLDMWNVTNNQTEFMQILFDTLDHASIEASSGRFGKKLATKEAKFQTVNTTLYTLAECTPDLTDSDCKNCLFMTVGNISEQCNEKAGCTLMCPSCNIRYEIYPFYGDDALQIFEGNNQTQVARKKHGLLTGTTVVSAAVVVVVLFGIWILRCKRKSLKAVKDSDVLLESDEVEAVEFLKYDFNQILKATNNFSPDEKLGEGGFGEVYKGRLENGQEVAIKRLSRNSKQGIAEFKTEVLLVAKLQHRNLVKLLGFYLTCKEKILVYEFLPNSSLDRFLSDPIKRASLDWTTRFRIINGIAKGILYLHEDSRLKIVHRDLKSSNILLDEHMNPKIADFGMAKLFGTDQTQGNTNKIVGTFGYMAPEYLIAGHFSVKSDVYSFGVVVLEMVSGARNKHFSQEQTHESVVHEAWRLWNEGTPLKLVDSCFGTSFKVEEVAKCIHIGLLCVQEDATKRPQIGSIVSSFNGESINLPSPALPRFLSVVQNGSNQCTTTSIDFDNITDVYPR